MSLAGGYKVGDRVVNSGRTGTVVGGPARAACIRLSVAVRYDDGRISDERIANIELLVDLPEEEYQEEVPMAPPPATLQEQAPNMQQQMASESMWGKRTPDYDEEPLEATTPLEKQLPPAGYTNGDTIRLEAPDSPESPPEAQYACQDAPGLGAEQAVQVVRDKIYRNYQDLTSAFRALDRSNNGYVSRAEFFQAMGDVFLSNGYTEDDIYDVADIFDLNKDGVLSFEEFVQVVEGGLQERAPASEVEPPLEPPEPVERSLMDDPVLVSNVDKAIQKFKIVVDQRYSAIREAFLKMDRERKGVLSPQNFADGLLAHGVALSADELELAYTAFDREGKGVITYTDFCAVMTQRFQFGAHLDRQMFR